METMRRLRGHQGRMWNVRWWFVALWKSLFSLFFSLARDALVTLLREQGKDDKVAALMRGELTKLDLRGCFIGDDRAEIIADFCKHDETVKMVSLLDCNIGLRGAKAIADALKHNQTLQYLSLNYNPIGDEGAEALIEALSYNVCMKSIGVVNNRIAPALRATIKYLTQTRNMILIPAAVRQASLSLIAARRNIIGAGILAIFPKEIVRMIAMEVWATRNQPIWINALSESKRTGISADYESYKQAIAEMNSGNRGRDEIA